MQSNNLNPRSELMTFIGLSEGTKGYIFMRSPNNNVFTAIQALFDETLFQNVQLPVVWVIHLWISLLMTCRVSITDLRIVRIMTMGVDYHYSSGTSRRSGAMSAHAATAATYAAASAAATLCLSTLTTFTTFQSL
jgi:hypothetical protein